MDLSGLSLAKPALKSSPTEIKLVSGKMFKHWLNIWLSLNFQVLSKYKMVTKHWARTFSFSLSPKKTIQTMDK
jgi:hypothetical protein